MEARTAIAGAITMTITVSPARNEYTANAGQTIFNYTFKIFQNTDLNVYVTPAGQDANDSTDITTLYTVTGIGDEDGGSITLAIPTNANDLVTIVSNIPSSRTTDYQNNGDFRPNVVNNDFDRVVSLVKKVEDRTNRGLLLPESQQDPKPLSLPIPKAGMPVRWNGDASGLENYDGSTVSNEEIANDKVVINYPTLLAAQSDASLKINQSCKLKERTIGNGGGGDWNVVLTSSVSPNGYNIVQSLAVPTLSLVLSQPFWGYNLAQWGLIKDVSTGSVPEDNFDVLEFASSQLDSYMSLEFPGGVVHLAHSRGYNPSKINGESAVNLQSLKSIWLNGNSTCIKVTDHDLSVNNGLLFLKYDAVQTLHVHGFTSEMSYINRNNSSTYYPFCGFAEGSDTLGTPTARTFDQLSSNIHCYNVTFNNFHPEGSYGQAQNSFPGDPNNGFKIYGFTAFGDTNAVGRKFQNSDVTFRDNNFLPTHNGYGFWAWAYNNVEAHSNKAKQYNSWSSDYLGNLVGGGVPMIRYHQWYCSGYAVHNNQFTARDLEDRVGPYIGVATFCHATQNGSFEWQRGVTNIHDNDVTLRTNDVGINVGVYGTINVHNNNVNGVLLSDRPLAGIDVFVGENGKSWISIKGNNVDENFSGPLVRVDCGASTAAKRRVKKLTIDSNEVEGSFGSIVSFNNNSSRAFVGVEEFFFRANSCNGKNSEFDPLNSNGAAVLSQVCNVASDVFTLRNNNVSDFYNLEKSGSQIVISEGNELNNITSSTNFNYLPINKQARSFVTATAGQVPRVGISSVDLFSYRAEKRDASTGLVLTVEAGEVTGGTSLAGATPAGEVWYIDQTLIAKKGS